MTEDETIDADSTNQKHEFHLYKRRWFMLSIFISFTLTNSIQWSEYTIISDSITKYYHVKEGLVDWTALVYMAAYIPLIFPALWLLDKSGIRFCLTLSSFGLALGAWIKVYASMAEDRFLFVLMGQGIEAIFQVLAFGFAARVAALWFGSHEVSFACSLAVFGDQMGAALGFLLPTEFVTGKTSEEIGRSLYSLNFMIAVTSTIIFLSALLFFRERPKTPPSAAQMLQKKSNDSNVILDIKKAFSSKSSVAMIVSYGINIACFNTYTVLFNNIFLFQFHNGRKHLGYLGASFMVSGVAGSIIIGYSLDRTHSYKITTLIMYLCSSLATLINAFTLRSKNVLLVYLSSMFIGFSQVGYYSIAIQLCIETTYPLSEGFSSSLLLLGSQVFGLLFSQITRMIYDKAGDLYATLGLTTMLFLGTLLTATIPSKMKRYKAEQQQTAQNRRNDVV